MEDTVLDRNYLMTMLTERSILEEIESDSALVKAICLLYHASKLWAGCCQRHDELAGGMHRRNADWCKAAILQVCYSAALRDMAGSNFPRLTSTLHVFRECFKKGWLAEKSKKCRCHLVFCAEARALEPFEPCPKQPCSLPEAYCDGV